jgi:prepilin-type N-terminal cleavage/methylation domain-containing protein
MRAQRGFTLVELMFVVAVIAILASVALPALLDTGRNVKGRSEVQSIFQDLRTRMEQYAMEKGAFPPSIGEATTFPVTPGPAAQTLSPQPQAWLDAAIRITTYTEAYCGYTWVTGVAGGPTGGLGAEAVAFGFGVPDADGDGKADANWYYLLAHCDLDGDATVDSYYFASSVDPTLLVQYEGH